MWFKHSVALLKCDHSKHFQTLKWSQVVPSYLLKSLNKPNKIYFHLFFPSHHTPQIVFYKKEKQVMVLSKI